MEDYENIRLSFKPSKIKILLIAESPPPTANKQSSRHFYRHELVRKDDRLFVNTIKAIYPEAEQLNEQELEENKKQWLDRFAADGFYMIEALGQSQVHEVTKKDRQQKIHDSLPRLLKLVDELASKNTGIILIKSNVYNMASEPLQNAGFKVLNSALVDYPGHFNQASYRRKLKEAIAKN